MSSPCSVCLMNRKRWRRLSLWLFVVTFSFLSSCGGRSDWAPSAQDWIRIRQRHRLCWFRTERAYGHGCECRRSRGAYAHASFGLTCCISIAACRPRAGDGAHAEPRYDTAVHMVGFARRQLSCALPAQYSFVIVHVLFPFVSASLKLAHRVAVLGSGSGTRGTDRQSIDVAGDVVNFRRGQFASILATQDSIVFVVSVHGLSFLLCVVVICAAGCGTSHLR